MRGLAVSGGRRDARNTDKLEINTDLEIGYRRGPNRVDWRSFAYCEESNDVQTEGKYSSRLIYLRDIRPRGRLFGVWFADRDDLATGERTTFRGGIGVGGAVEMRAGEETITVPSLLAHLTYRHEFEGGDSLEGMAYVLPYLDYFERSPMHLELRHAYALRKHLDLTAGFLADYVVDPPADTKSYDTKITFGLRRKR